MPSFFTATVTPGPLLVNADNLIEITGLRRQDTDAEVNSGATGTFQVTDTAGAVVQSATAMTATGSDGVWRGIMPDVPDTIALRAGESYIVSVTMILDTSLEQTVFTAGKMASHGVGFYNWFGASPGQVVDLYPGAVLDDFGAGDPTVDQHSIGQALTSAVHRILGAAPPAVFDALHRVEAEVIEGNASAGQTVVVVSLPGVVDSSLLLFKNWTLCPVKPKPTDAVAAATYAVSRETDPADADYRKLKVTFEAGSELALGDTIHATYDLNHDDDNYRFPDLADLAAKIAAADVGGRLYRTNTTVWALVEQYLTEANGRIEDLHEGRFVPNQIRAMTLCEEIETTAGQAVGSVPWARAT